jgi:hypothetical protein
MKFFSLLLFLIVQLRADVVEDFCRQFASVEKILVYKGLPNSKFETEKRAEAEKGVFRYLLGEAFYLDPEVLKSDDAKKWLRTATDFNSYLPCKRTDLQLDGGFHADVAFWCISKDYKVEAYLLCSMGTDEVQIFCRKSGQTMTMSLEMKNSTRAIISAYFETAKRANQPPEPTR